MFGFGDEKRALSNENDRLQATVDCQRGQIHDLKLEVFKRKQLGVSTLFVQREGEHLMVCVECMKGLRTYADKRNWLLAQHEDIQSRLGALVDAIGAKGE